MLDRIRCGDEFLDLLYHYATFVHYIKFWDCLKVEIPLLWEVLEVNNWCFLWFVSYCSHNTYRLWPHIHPIVRLFSILFQVVWVSRCLLSKLHSSVIKHLKIEEGWWRVVSRILRSLSIFSVPVRILTCSWRIISYYFVIWVWVRSIIIKIFPSLKTMLGRGQICIAMKF